MTRRLSLIATAFSLILPLMGTSVFAQDQPTQVAAETATPAPPAEAWSKVTFRGADNRQFDVWIDGTRLGLTPISVELPSGRRMVSASAELLSPVIEYIEFIPDQSHDIILPVEPLTNQNYTRITANVVGALKLAPKNAHISLIAAMTAQDPKDAWTMLSRGEQMAPANPTSMLIRGKRLQVEKKYDESLNVLDEGLQLDVRYAAIHRQRARTLTQMRRLNEAVDAVTIAIEIDPNDWQSYYTRAIIYGEIKDKDRARKDLDKALVLSPKNSEVLQALKDMGAK